jgi:hypothetical protein
VTIDGDDLAEQSPIEQISRDSEPKQTCEACGAKIATEDGKRIDSGQFLCHKCLKFFSTA